MSKGCNCCDYAAHILERKDFRQSKGDGPEEMPHRKKRGKNKGAPKGDHKHLWETNGWERKFKTHYKFNPEGDIWGNKWKMITDYSKWYFVRHYECLICGKPGKRQEDFPKGWSHFWYGN